MDHHHTDTRAHEETTTGTGQQSTMTSSQVPTTTDNQLPATASTQEPITTSTQQPTEAYQQPAETHQNPTNDTLADSPAQNRSGSITFSSSAEDPNATTQIGSGNGDRHASLSAMNPDSQHPAKDVSSPVNPATESNPLASHHRPSVQGDDHQGLSGDTPITNPAGVSQNAPGKAGSVGENAMGALGMGGSTVGRPKEDQGIGEKIANFLGA